MDDYLFFFSPTSDDVTSVLPQILNMLNSMGVLVTVSKFEGPAMVVTFLGIVVDTIRFKLRLPEEKLSYILGLTTQWQGRLSGRYELNHS